MTRLKELTMSHDSAFADDDLIDVFDDPQPESGASNARIWRVLIVDDDQDIHDSTRFALKGREILGREVELVHAYSAAEARRHIVEYEDIAVAFVDVVMETPFAGLNLVRELREAGYTDMRIVLRTGQPGYAPELSVITSYEIDDYRTKVELTQMRLLTVLTSCIRAYNQIRTLSRSREGLEMIVQAAPQLFRRANMEMFSSGVLLQIASLLHVEPSGIVSVEKNGDTEMGRIISAAGSYTTHLGKPFSEITDSRARNLLYQAERRGEPILEDGQLALRFRSENGQALSTLVEAKCEVAAPELALLKLFATNISIGFENLELMEQLDHLAFIDPVLQIPNQNAFEAALRRELASGSGGARMALVNVDSYAFIAAHYGLRVANQFLDEIQKSMTRERQGRLIVARVGDGTLALLGNRNGLDDLLLEQVFDEPHDIDGIDLASTGTGVIIDLDDDISRDS
jgi:GGDEF domain-containing protein